MTKYDDDVIGVNSSDDSAWIFLEKSVDVAVLLSPNRIPSRSRMCRSDSDRNRIRTAPGHLLHLRLLFSFDSASRHRTPSRPRTIGMTGTPPSPPFPHPKRRMWMSSVAIEEHVSRGRSCKHRLGFSPTVEADHAAFPRTWTQASTSSAAILDAPQ